MRRVPFTILLLVIALGIGAGGYWLGRRNVIVSPQMAARHATDSAVPSPAGKKPERKLLYYKHPMGEPDFSPSPKKDSMGMDYIPVYEGDEGGGANSASAPPAPGSAGKVQYYRNPMGLPDTSPVPKKDSMGMDYIPVYEGDDNDAGTVKISLAKVQRLGVQTASVERRALTHTVRAVGTVQPDERRLFIVNTKFEGWIERLLVNSTGQSVHRDEPLMEIYSPELVAVQREYLLAWQSLQAMADASPDVRTSARQLADAALQRLKNWDISDDQVKRLQRTASIARTLTLRAPANGIVMEKMAVEGMHFMAGDPLYRIADLTRVWLTAEVFEQDLGSLRAGQDAEITVNAYPGTAFTGTVDFVYPTVSQETRTGKVRIVVQNADGRLKTGMYANVALEASLGGTPVLALPASAVIDGGAQQIVLIERGKGAFEPRPVKLGAKADGFYEVREGLAGDERVVVSANFLIDAESNLRAALKAFAPADGNTPPTPSGGQP